MFVEVKSWNLVKCFLLGEWIYKMWFLRVMELGSVRSNELFLYIFYIVILIYFKSIRLSERNIKI